MVGLCVWINNWFKIVMAGSVSCGVEFGKFECVWFWLAICI